jgi:von Willebrand factor type A domain
LEGEVTALAVEPPDALVEPARTGCVDITRSYSSVPATVLLLIDQSQSMSFAFGDSTRWSVLREAIIDRDVGLLASLDPNARVGLMLYTGQGGSSNPLGCPLLTQVSAEFDNVEAVREAYGAAGPQRGGDTPTGESITQAALALSGVTSAAPRYILLATDGVPDTCAQPKPSEGLPLALEAASAAFAQGIRVFVLGVSDGLDAWRVQQLANAGAGKDPNLVYGVDADAEEPLSASADPRELAGQLRGIIGDVRSCTIELGTRVSTQRVLDGRLALDGEPLANDRRNGWTFIDDDTLRLNGVACDKVLDDGERLEVRFPCDDPGARLR